MMFGKILTKTLQKVMSKQEKFQEILLKLLLEASTLDIDEKVLDL